MFSFMTEDQALALLELAWAAEEVGISPEGLGSALLLAHRCTDMFSPAALVEACPHLRVGAVQTRRRHTFGGEAIGQYLDWTILVWPKGEEEILRQRPRPGRPRA